MKTVSGACYREYHDLSEFLSVFFIYLFTIIILDGNDAG
jgi:hypothetical protein